MKIKPIGDRILVQAATAEETTKSGIILPASAEQETKSQGKIVALGNGEEIGRLGLKVGATVVYGKYSGDEVEQDGAKYKILNVGKEKDSNEVLATIEE